MASLTNAETCAAATTPAAHDMWAALPDTWIWAAAIVVIVLGVVLAWLVAKQMDHRLTARVVDNYGCGALRELTELHRVSSMSVVAEVLRSVADIIRAARGGKPADDESAPP